MKGNRESVSSAGHIRERRSKMKIQLSMDYLRGCVRMETGAQGVELQRLCASMMDFCRNRGTHCLIRAKCPSGVRIVLQTDSPFLRLPFQFGNSARELFEFDVFCDGRSVAHTVTGQVLEVRLDGSLHTVEILPPHLVECCFGEMEAADGARVSAVRKPEKTFLFLGDSIMQGMTVSRPSLAYADRLARMQGADYYNLSVGGMTACRQLGKFAMEYHWDRMFLCFGVNDFNLQRPVADFIADMTGILEETADRPVVLLSPIHMPGRSNVNPAGVAFQQFRDEVAALAEDRRNVTFVDGTELLPKEDRWYIDGLHPNDAGEDLLFRNLAEIVK